MEDGNNGSSFVYCLYVDLLRYERAYNKKCSLPPDNLSAQSTVNIHHICNLHFLVYIYEQKTENLCL